MLLKRGAPAELLVEISAGRLLVLNRSWVLVLSDPIKAEL